MAARARTHKNTRGKSTASWKEGREPIKFDVTPELKAVLDLIARDSGISVSQLVSILLEEEVSKKRMEDSVRKKITMAFKKNFLLITHFMPPTLAPRVTKQSKKGFSN